MQRLEVSGAVGPIYGSLGAKRLRNKKEIDITVRISPTRSFTKSDKKNVKSKDKNPLTSY
jgi:hypothetical protein